MNAPTQKPLLSVADLVVEYGRGTSRLRAVAGVDLEVRSGESVGIVGESGCGKSSLGRAILQLKEPAQGSVRFIGAELTTLPPEQLRAIRSDMQVVLQDPVAALNPRRKVVDIVAEGLLIHGVPRKEARSRAKAVLREVGLDPDIVGDRRPRQFSGGQCQRIAIARAMALRPQLLLCDEPVASLDVSVQAQVLTLLLEMKAQAGLAMIFISHDLAVVMNVCNRVVVMYLGKIVEEGTSEQISRAPRHPYSRILLDSVPQPDPRARPTTDGIKGEIPSPRNPPTGCRFRTRCPLAQDICAREEPALTRGADGRAVACHFPLPTDSPVADAARSVSHG